MASVCLVFHGRGLKMGHCVDQLLCHQIIVTGGGAVNIKGP